MVRGAGGGACIWVEAPLEVVTYIDVLCVPWLYAMKVKNWS